MKKINFLSMIMSVAVIVSLIVVSACTKEGPAGKDGEPGIDGTDGTATCGTCHNFTEDLTAKIAQYDYSTHATGITSYEGNRQACAGCHTSKGFREIIENDTTSTLLPVSNPTQPNCYTCHNIHQTYTDVDWTLATVAPVKFRLDGGNPGATYDGGNGNLCANCHQARIITPYPDAANLTGTVTFTSFRYGPHYGTQSQVVSGQCGFELGFDGPVTHAHSDIENTCTACHMAEPFGQLAGGHNMGIFIEEEGSLNFAGCLDCHTDEEALAEATEELKTEVTELEATLWDLLVAEGIADPANYGYAIVGTYSNEVAGAYLNWKFVHHDRSFGAHNPTFTKTLLENSIEALQSN